MSLVLDSSVALAWAYEEENTPAILRVFDLLFENGAWVPGLWRLEIANILETGVRRGRRDPGFRDRTLDRLAQYPIQVDSETDRHAWGATLQLATRHRLTLYDAAYLELAQRLRVPLATLDRDLAAAAKAEGVAVLGED